MHSAVTAASSLESKEESKETPNKKKSATKPKWFEIKAQRLVDRDTILAVRLSHILLETEAMADTVWQKVKDQTVSFEELAASMSMCDVTRGEKGLVGWVAPSDAHLDEVVPPEVRHSVLVHAKPGDVWKTRSGRGWHLCRVEDVMFAVRPALFAKGERRRERHLGKGGVSDALRGLGGGVWGAERNEEDDGREDQLRLSFDTKESRDMGRHAVSPSPLSDPALPSAPSLPAAAVSGRPLRYLVETMGCQMNKADSERMKGQLESLGFEETEKQGEADVVVLNTCSIRDRAEQKVYSQLGPYAARKRSGEDVALVVAGCVAQQEAESLLRRVPEVDLVMGPQYANRLGDLLEHVGRGNQVVATDPAYIMEDITQARRDSDVCAWVNIIYGCNEHCTYCVVPTTRGVEQSRPSESILQEIRELGARGYREVTLLGQNIDAWGRDMNPRRRFADLLKMAAEECTKSGIHRLRFTTSHPRYMTDSVIDVVADAGPLCEFLHVPMQSGDTEVLRRMRRGYSREKCLRIVEYIKKKMPDASIGTDVIVGFPGETDEQFQNTVSLMEEVQFDAMMSAAYSPRPNTPAAEWDDQVPERVKSERLQLVTELSKKHIFDRSQRFLGRTEEVLVEGANPKIPGQVMGRTRHNRLVFFDGDVGALKGELVDVRIDTARAFHLTGSPVRVRPAEGTTERRLGVADLVGKTGDDVSCYPQSEAV
uniref:Uncharacterized protein n=1 Tax=Chromera velia CCMP2878 TaxID=1169474 RepID=A0A0G4HEZ9_9ALVE|eukprot:Cvel_6562.t1-p1 / transcript=Cvel_6562.t1 / gene=Cvel_6562 / organism=Chromera_velia_CCMP2878 / gene_product=(Dimethylallyl)adenosine tRNA methylthiotransferase, putative / transcript_product=(Dimethylallyl)adenosine tRNA methylthiotransferase, putative / location=Cvel_scaffold323:65450-71773(-) / protein_length=710 / sequence_SO=supercontig / SO=protein_coding / is_pseudo=false